MSRLADPDADVAFQLQPWAPRTSKVRQDTAPATEEPTQRHQRWLLILYKKNGERHFSNLRGPYPQAARDRDDLLATVEHEKAWLILDTRPSQRK